MSSLQDFIESRRQEIETERLKLQAALTGSSGFTSPRAMQFMTDVRMRQLVLDELERLAGYTERLALELAEANMETPETPTRRPGRPRKASE